MNDITLIENAVRVAVQDVTQRHKERFIQEAVREYEQFLRAKLAEAADHFTTIVRSEIRDDVTVNVQMIFKGRR